MRSDGIMVKNGKLVSISLSCVEVLLVTAITYPSHTHKSLPSVGVPALPSNFMKDEFFIANKNSEVPIKTTSIYLVFNVFV